MQDPMWDAAAYARDFKFVTDLGAPVLNLLAAQSGERILDLGCGDGKQAALLVATGARVVAVDSSPSMVAAAVARGVDARLADGEHLEFEGEFDAVFSNAALHWMSRSPKGVVEGVARSLIAGGRFIGEFGGFGNVAAILTALRAALKAHGVPVVEGVLYFPTPAEYSAVLSPFFTVHYIELVPRPTPLPAGGISAWLAEFSKPFTQGIAPETRSAVLADAEALLRPQLCDASGAWTADYVRLRFKATKKGDCQGAEGLVGGGTAAIADESH